MTPWWNRVHTNYHKPRQTGYPWISSTPWVPPQKLIQISLASLSLCFSPQHGWRCSVETKGTSAARSPSRPPAHRHPHFQSPQHQHYSHPPFTYSQPPTYTKTPWENKGHACYQVSSPKHGYGGPLLNHRLHRLEEQRGEQIETKKQNTHLKETKQEIGT